MGLELVEIVVEGKQTDNELLDLDSATGSASWTSHRGQAGSILLKVFECVLQEIRNIFLQEIFVRRAQWGLVGAVNRVLHLARLDKEEHP